MIVDDLFESPQTCPECGGPAFSDLLLAEKKDACYHKVRSRYKVWPSAYASGALVQCRKKGAANWGNKSESIEEDQLEEITRRDLLKGAGAAAVAGAGLSPMPAKAWFFFIIPLPNTSPDAAANACMPPGVQVGQKVNYQGEMQVVQKIHGVSNRCQNPNMPVAVTVGKPEPAQTPIVKEPPNQNTPPNYGSRIISRIRPNIFYTGDTTGNPRAEVEVRVSSDGTITSVKLEKSSGNTEWDQAVIKAVEKTEKMPLDTNGSVPSIMILGFRPVDSLREDQLDEKCWDTHRQAGMKKKGDRMVPNCVPKEGVEEDNFAGDTRVELGGTTAKKLRSGDTVSYFGEPAKVVELNPAKNYARISANGKTLNVRLSDLKRTGQGVAETDNFRAPAAMMKASPEALSQAQNIVQQQADKNVIGQAKIAGAVPNQGVDEGDKIGNMDADRFDDAMSRLKQLAGQGPRKTVWDPVKRVYKTVPVSQQPVDKK